MTASRDTCTPFLSEMHIPDLEYEGCVVYTATYDSLINQDHEPSFLVKMIISNFDIDPLSRGGVPFL
jgi:hypothetical protein